MPAVVVTPATDKPDAEGRMPVPFPFRVHAMCHDNENNNWLWGARMWGFENVERTTYGYVCVSSVMCGQRSEASV